MIARIALAGRRRLSSSWTALRTTAPVRRNARILHRLSLADPPAWLTHGRFSRQETRAFRTAFPSRFDRHKHGRVSRPTVRLADDRGLALEVNNRKMEPGGAATRTARRCLKCCCPPPNTPIAFEWAFFPAGEAA